MLIEGILCIIILKINQLLAFYHFNASMFFFTVKSNSRLITIFFFYIAMNISLLNIIL